MKKRFLLIAVTALSVAEVGAQTEYGSWSINTCYKGLSYRSRSNGYVSAVNKYSYHAQVQNNYDRKVTFNMYWEVDGEKQTIGQFTLSPGAVTNAVSYYFKANSNMMYVEIDKVCFADASSGGCGVYGMCYAECDNGSPNIPTNCSGTSGNNNANTNKTQTNTNSTYSANTSPTTNTFTSTTTQPNKSVALNLLQNPEFINTTATTLDDFFAAVKKRKEERRRQKELKEEAKKDAADKEKEKMSYHTLFETKAFNAYCQYTMNEILQKGDAVFKTVDFYGIFENSKYAIISFDKLKLSLMYNYYASSDLTASITLEFKNKNSVEEFLKSDAFTVFKNNSITNTIGNKKIDFSSVKFDNDQGYKNVASQIQNNDYIVNINMLFDSITRKAESPIDTTKSLAEALRGKGNIYNRGNGIMQDKQTALEFYQKAWELGDVKSAVEIGNLFLFDPFKDYIKARAYFDSAAAKGEISAMNGIGLMYQYGNGVTKDIYKAKQLYEKAAELGDIGGMISLYYLYKYDETEKNLALAKQWLKKACDANLTDSKFYCDMLEQED
jgi:TPR repeat protein